MPVKRVHPVKELVNYHKNKLYVLEQELLTITNRAIILKDLIHSETLTRNHNQALLKKIKRQDNHQYLPSSQAAIESATKALVNHITKSEIYIASMEQSLLANEQSLLQKDQQCEEQKKFIFQFTHDARPMLKDFYAAICQAINHYENYHALGQASVERIFWRRIQTLLVAFPQLVFVYDNGRKFKHAATVYAHQFAFLTGLVLFMAERIATIKKVHDIDIPFDTQYLLQVFVVLYSTLPLPPNFGEDCKSFFNSYAFATKSLRVSQLLAVEAAEYAQAIAVLKHNSRGELADPINAELIVALVEKQVNTAIAPDYKYFTHLLSLAYECLKSSANEDAVIILKVLAESAPGAPSRWSVLANATSGVASLLGVAASIYVTIVQAEYYSTASSRSVIFGTTLAGSMFAAARHYLPTAPTGIAQALQEVVTASNEILHTISLR